MILVRIVPCITLFYIDIEKILFSFKWCIVTTKYFMTRRYIVTLKGWLLLVKCYIVTTEFYIVKVKRRCYIVTPKRADFFNIERLRCDRFVLCFYYEMIKCYVVTNNIGSLLEAYIVFSKDFKLKMKKLYWKRQWLNPQLCGYIFEYHCCKTMLRCDCTLLHCDIYD